MDKRNQLDLQQSLHYAHAAMSTHQARRSMLTAAEVTESCCKDKTATCDRDTQARKICIKLGKMLPMVVRLDASCCKNTRQQLVTVSHTHTYRQKASHALDKTLATAAELDASCCKDKTSIRDAHAQARKQSIQYLCSSRLALADGGVAHFFLTALGAGVWV